MVGVGSQIITQTLAAAVTFLQVQQQPEGGWSYGANRFCYVEPTALATLALGLDETGGSMACADIDTCSAVQTALSWLQSQVNQAGAIVLPDDPDNPHWSTALALFTAVRLGLTGNPWDAVTHFLLGWEAATIGYDPAVPLNTELKGWPWYPGAFGWVIPTAHAILALRLTGQGAHARVADGEALLLDRMCEGGGWNYGNREVLGQMLQPMVDTTAWALLALHDRPAAQEAAALGLEILDREVRPHPSSLSLALAILCFDLYGRSSEDLVPLLLERQMDDGSWYHQVHLTALAMLALKAVLGVGNAFALQA